MIRLMNSGVSGMINHQTRMDIIGNNISNENTIAYKAGRATFKDALYQAMSAPGTASGANQVGTGVGLSGISNNFEQGMLQPTGRTLDLAITGTGFFGVKEDPDSDNVKYTRDGSFFFDQDGYLRNSDGHYVVDADEYEIRVKEVADREELYINEKGELRKISFDGDETVDESIDDLKIGLFYFENTDGLTKAGGNLYMKNNTTGERFDNGDDDAEGFGTISSGYLEASNLNIIDEMASLIATQRGYQANARVFTTADEVLQEIIQLKR